MNLHRTTFALLGATLLTTPAWAEDMAEETIPVAEIDIGASARAMSTTLHRTAHHALGYVQVQARPVRTADGRGWVGFQPSERTVRAESAPIAAIGDAAAVVVSTPRFSRNEGDILRGAPWTVELDTLLARPAHAGAAQLVFTDIGDRKGNEEHGTTATLQARVPRTDRIAARVVLSLEDGFQPGHTYRVKVAQLIGKKHVVLAEGELRLE